MKPNLLAPLFLLVAGGLVVAAPARALPTGPRAFCDTYPETPACGGQVPTCAQCHTVPPALNPYGLEVGGELWATPGYSLLTYDDHVGDALRAVEAGDADGDGTSNLEEIELGTWPGDALSFYEASPAPTGKNDFYDVGQWDARFAFRRVSVLYCGRPPSYEQMRGLPAPSTDEGSTDEAKAAAAEAVRALLADCLDSDYWKGEGLLRLADKRIRPLEAVGFDGVIPLADYAWDYRLFSHILTGDRDARDLLLADYHVGEDGDVVEGAIAAPPSSPLGTGGQPVPPAQRAGMITTQWFLMIHTMFSELPRTTAAQAYRAYLGQDIAKSEGILPVEGEPRDVDNKGVTAEACARCHSTIDPLSYAFSAYNGIGDLGDLYDFEDTGAYNPSRTPWGEDSVLLGQPVPSLRAWAETAASSDMFKRNLAHMFFVHALGREPRPDEQDAFRALWESLPADGYSANKLIERLVFTDAFGVP